MTFASEVTETEEDAKKVLSSINFFCRLVPCPNAAIDDCETFLSYSAEVLAKSHSRVPPSQLHFPLEKCAASAQGATGGWEGGPKRKEPSAFDTSSVAVLIVPR